MSDTPSIKNHQKNFNNQHIHVSRYDSTAEFRLFKKVEKLTMLKTLLRKKPINVHHVSSLKRCLTTFDLILFGIGAIIGAGVFVLTGIAAATKAGPAIILSYSIAGLASMFAALS